MNNSDLQNRHDARSFAMVSLTPAHRSARTCRTRAVAHVPFDFVVGEKVLRAGAYTVEPSGTVGLLILRRAGSGSQAGLVHAISRGRRRAVHKLLFYCQQNSYFLAQAVVGLT